MIIFLKIILSYLLKIRKSLLLENDKAIYSLKGSNNCKNEKNPWKRLTKS